jgi:hypothetical protein
VDANKLIGELQDLLTAAAGELFTVQLRLGTDLPRVRIDPFRLQEGLVRLVLDAREAVPQGGTLIVSTASTSRPASATPGTEASDCVGVTFECQLARSETDQQQTGGSPSIFTGDGFLGRDGLLAISGFLREVGGHVEISEVETSDRVSSLTMYLPVVTSATRRPAEKAPLAMESRKLRVLLVEDDSSVLRLMTRLLEYRGAQVRATADGIEALRYLELEHFDILVTDIVMPRLGGADVVRTARRRQPEIRVLILSGYRPEEAGIDELLDEGCAFLSKPFSGAELSAAIAQLLLQSSPDGAATAPQIAAIGG